MIEIITGYILIAIIVFFSSFYLIIKKYKKTNTTLCFTEWYLDDWMWINISFSIFWMITIPVALTLWSFVKACKVIMKHCGVK